MDLVIIPAVKNGYRITEIAFTSENQSNFFNSNAIATGLVIPWTVDTFTSYTGKGLFDDNAINGNTMSSLLHVFYEGTEDQFKKIKGLDESGLLKKFRDKIVFYSENGEVGTWSWGDNNTVKANGDDDRPGALKSSLGLTFDKDEPTKVTGISDKFTGDTLVINKDETGVAITSIGANILNGNTKIKNVILASSVTSVENGAFGEGVTVWYEGDKEKLEALTLGDEIASYYYASEDPDNEEENAWHYELDAYDFASKPVTWFVEPELQFPYPGDEELNKHEGIYKIVNDTWTKTDKAFEYGNNGTTVMPKEIDTSCSNNTYVIVLPTEHDGKTITSVQNLGGITEATKEAKQVSIVMPLSIKSIGYNVFKRQNVDTVYFEYPESRAVEIVPDGTGNTYYKDAKKYYYSYLKPKDPNKQATTWHWKAGKVVLWAEDKGEDLDKGQHGTEGVNYEGDDKSIVDESPDVHDVVIIAKQEGGADVTNISQGAFSNNPSITALVIPETVDTIGEGSFGNNPNLTAIYFEGTSEQWQHVSITCDYLSTAITNNTIKLYYYEYKDGIGDATLWHYANGKPTPWVPEEDPEDPDFGTHAATTGVQFENNEVTTSPSANTETVIIPSFNKNGDDERVISGISLEAFSGNSTMKAIVIPRTAVKLPKGVFSSCSSLTTIFYEGTEQDWTSRVVANSQDNTELTNYTNGQGKIKVYFYSKEEPDDYNSGENPGDNAKKSWHWADPQEGGDKVPTYWVEPEEPSPQPGDDDTENEKWFETYAQGKVLVIGDDGTLTEGKSTFTQYQSAEKMQVACDARDQNKDLVFVLPSKNKGSGDATVTKFDGNGISTGQDSFLFFTDNTKTLHFVLPSSITEYGYKIFGDATVISGRVISKTMLKCTAKFYYQGTKEEFDSVTIGQTNSSLLDAKTNSKILFYSATKTDNGWHWVEKDGNAIPQAWSEADA